MEPTSRRRFLTTAATGAAALLATGCVPATPRVAPTPAVPDATLHYGNSPFQLADFYLPKGRTGPLPTVVLIHGGYWQITFNRTLMHPLIGPLLAEGWAVLNLEYRPVGFGGGWPATFFDVASGIDLLATSGQARRCDLSRVFLVGHSAGGTLALWGASRHGLPAGAPGSSPKVDAKGVVSLAGLTDLETCSVQNLGGGACTEFMGGPPGADNRYSLASPHRRLPLHRPQFVVHGTWDLIVPYHQSQIYVRDAKLLGDDAQLHTAHAVEHLGVIDPTRSHWRATMGWLRTQAGLGLP